MFYFLFTSHKASFSKKGGTLEDQKLLSAMPPWDYREYAQRCSGCYNGRRVLEMALDGGHLSIYDRRGRAKDTFMGAGARRRKKVEKVVSRCFLECPGFGHLGCPPAD